MKRLDLVRWFCASHPHPINLKSTFLWSRVKLWSSHLPLKWEARIEESTCCFTTGKTLAGKNNHMVLWEAEQRTWCRLVWEELSVFVQTQGWATGSANGATSSVVTCLKIPLFVPPWCNPLITGAICFSAYLHHTFKVLCLLLWEPGKEPIRYQRSTISFFFYSPSSFKGNTNNGHVTKPFMFREHFCIHYPLNSHNNPVKHSCRNRLRGTWELT